MSGPLLSAHDLCIKTANRVLIEHLNLELWPGQRLAVLGQNGTGKTSLLHSLMGLRPVAHGGIAINQQALNTWSRPALARQFGLLFQKLHDDMPATVRETAMLGRLPHARNWQWETEEDWATVDAALHAMDLANIAEREVSSLSGGERQRLAIAALLAQNPHVYLLDEPGNHLDISFQIKVLRLFRREACVNHKALLMATHDINLVSGFCDRVLLLYGNGQFRLGEVHEVLRDDILSEVYQCKVRHVEASGNRVFFVDKR